MVFLTCFKGDGLLDLGATLTMWLNK